MSTQELLTEALRLKAIERLQLVDALVASLDEPDPAVDRIWAGEAEKRLRAYDEGRLEAVPIEEVLGEND